MTQESEKPEGFVEFLQGYIACALWSSTDESDESGGEPMDSNYDESDIAPDTRADMERDCEDFMRANAATLARFLDITGKEWSCAGHDFWLTRNRHGAGFWDRGAGETGKELTKAAHACGGVDLYVGDDNQIHGM